MSCQLKVSVTSSPPRAEVRKAGGHQRTWEQNETNSVASSCISAPTHHTHADAHFVPKRPDQPSAGRAPYVEGVSQVAPSPKIRPSLTGIFVCFLWASPDEETYAHTHTL